MFTSNPKVILLFAICDLFAHLICNWFLQKCYYLYAGSFAVVYVDVGSFSAAYFDDGCVISGYVNVGLLVFIVGYFVGSVV